MKTNVFQLGKISLPFGIAVALHSLGIDHETLGSLGSSAGISPLVLESIFRIGAEGFVAEAHEKLAALNGNINSEVNHDLEKAIIDSYKSTLQRIEKDFSEELFQKETFAERALRVVFGIENKAYDATVDFEISFSDPVMELLMSDEQLELLLKGNQFDRTGAFIREAIRKAVPACAGSDDISGNAFLDIVCSKFEQYFRLYFLQKIKQDERAKTAFFTHLLTTISENTRNIERDLPIIKDFATQAGLKLDKILRYHKESSSKIKKILNDLEIYRSDIKQAKEKILKDVGMLISPVLDKRDRRDRLDKGTQSNKFDFRYRYLDFIGRESEMSRIWSFIGSKEDLDKFRWWIVTGPGGIGKSRIAQQLCLLDEGYYSGFFDFKSISQNPRWDLWQPELPSLIVIDYALSKAGEVAELITTLEGRRNTFRHPVRLLLLDRDLNEEWKRKVRPGTELYDSLYKEIPSVGEMQLKLLPFNEELQWSLLEQTIKKENFSLLEKLVAEKERVLENLNKLDPEHRPLFTYLAAMAIAHGNNITDWNSHQLLDHTLNRLEATWFNCHHNPELDEKIRQVLFINTMCNQLSAAAVENLLKELSVGQNYSEFRNTYCLVTTFSQENGSILWDGLQPDLLGELFILKTIHRILEEHPAQGTQLVELLIRVGLGIDPFHVCLRTAIAWRDFQATERFGLKLDLFKIVRAQIDFYSDPIIKDLVANLFYWRALYVFYNLSYQPNGIFLLSKFKNMLIEDVSASIELKEKESAFWSLRGSIFYTLKMHKEAISDFNHCLDIGPAETIVYRLRGESYIFLGFYKEAMDDLNKSIDLDPEDGKSYALRASLRTLRIKDGILNRRVIQSALNDCDKAIKLETEKGRMHNIRGDLLTLSGKKNLACKEYYTSMTLGCPEGKENYLKYSRNLR